MFLKCVKKEFWEVGPGDPKKRKPKKRGRKFKHQKKQ